MDYYFASTSNTMSEEEKLHRRLAQKIAEETIVLLKNSGALPLAENERRIGLYGSGARNTVKGGSGSGEVHTRDNLSLEMAFADAGFELTSQAWIDNNEKKNQEAQADYLAKMRQKAEETGVDINNLMLENHFTAPDDLLITESEAGDAGIAVYVIARIAGEGADRKLERRDFYLSENELANIRLLAEKAEKCIVIFNGSGVIDTAELSEIKGISALIQMGQLGNTGSAAMVRVLTGQVNPSGKLAATWAKKYEDYPSAATFSHRNGNLDDEYYTEDVYVGYRYFDAFGIEPRYEFGFGLSYTDFEISAGQPRQEGKVLTLPVSVRNTGKAAGKEVVQVYAGYASRRGRSLVAFQKTEELAAGEQAGFELTVGISRLATYNSENAQWVIEAGSYPLYVGNSSRKLQKIAILKVKKAQVLTQLQNKLVPQDDFEILKTQKQEEPEDAVVEEVDLSVFPTEVIEYPVRSRLFADTMPSKKLTVSDVKAGKARLEDLTAQLTPEELTDLCVGSFGESKVQIVMGSSSTRVPGAGGNTCSDLIESRGIENLIMADGPVGLRLNDHFRATEDHILVTPENEEELKGQKLTDYYQYCTALPIASNMAQSWNPQVLKIAGQIVTEEMETFGISLWLAPGMNIQRNPLGGRCFEYYSEDPYLTGVCASEITGSIQSHPSCGVVLKHYAANNQEDNRMFTNAHVTEQALREIYLRGFEYAIRESAPTGIMTAYNMINGLHCANNYELIEDIARSEFGFDGIVMTDWFATYDMQAMMGLPKMKYDRSFSDRCVAAGNDLVMPGGDMCKAEILKAYEDGRLSLAQLQYCARDIIKLSAAMK